VVIIEISSYTKRGMHGGGKKLGKKHPHHKNPTKQNNKQQPTTTPKQKKKKKKKKTQEKTPKNTKPTHTTKPKNSGDTGSGISEGRQEIREKSKKATHSRGGRGETRRTLEKELIGQDKKEKETTT